MSRKKLTVKDFRDTLKQLIEGDRIYYSHGNDSGFLDTLDKLEQMSDEDLLQAKLYADLGLDSIDVWEMVCMIERDYGVYIENEVEEAFDTGVCLSVESYLKALNTYQI